MLPTKIKRKVDLVSSHSDNERDDGPLAAYSTKGSPAPTFTGPIEYHRSCVILQNGEQVRHEEIYVLDACG